MVHPFCQYARTQIKEVLAVRGESLRWLSKQTKIEYHRIYRIDAGEMKTLSYFDAKKFLTFVEPETADDTLKRFYPAEAGHLPAQPSVDANEQQDRLLAFTLRSQLHWTVFLHIATKGRVPRAEVKEIAGKIGMKVLEELLDCGVVAVDDDHLIYSNIDRERMPSEQSLVAEAHMQISLLDFDSSGTYVRNEQHRYNAAGRAAIYSLFQTFKEKLRSIDTDPRYAGDQLYVYTLALGSLNGGANHES